MEPSSKVYGDRTEECQSSESGWTMYIAGSSMDDDDDDDVDDGGGRNKGTFKDEDEDTDDSMTSDASSGPSHLHLQQPWEVQQDETHGKHNPKCSSKKNKKAERKKKGGHDQESRNKKEDSLVVEKRGAVTTLQSGNRAWFLSKRN